MKKSSRSISVTLFSLALVALTSLPVWAKPKIEVNITASKEVVEVVNGARVVKSLPAQSAVTGDTLTFTVNYRNSGNEAATNAVINTPVSAGMTYIDNSANGKNADVSFSIDGGKTYKKPSLLSYEVKQPNGKVEKHTARPEEYSHIRWVINSVPPNSTGTVLFKVRIK